MTPPSIADVLSRAADGWIEWSGGECPLEPGIRYERRYRGGREQFAHVHKDPEWNDDIWAHDPTDPHRDIIAYRVVSK
jgi:hypothetical protein